jgi:prophage regulatory protein
MVINCMAETYLSDIQLAARFGVHRATPWRWAKHNRDFPKAISLSAGCARWKLSEIEAWESAKTETSRR